MMDILNILLSESFWAASLRIATPLIFGVLGAQGERNPARLVIVAVIAGAFAGNFLWGKFVSGDA